MKAKGFQVLLNKEADRTLSQSPCGLKSINIAKVIAQQIHFME